MLEKMHVVTDVSRSAGAEHRPEALAGATPVSD